MRVICCVCNKVKTSQGWLPLAASKEDRPSHGFCPGCHERMLRKIMTHGNKADHADVAA